jgi:hypothetical protein
MKKADPKIVDNLSSKQVIKVSNVQTLDTVRKDTALPLHSSMATGGLNVP